MPGPIVSQQTIELQQDDHCHSLYLSLFFMLWLIDVDPSVHINNSTLSFKKNKCKNTKWLPRKCISVEAQHFLMTLMTMQICWECKNKSADLILVGSGESTGCLYSSLFVKAAVPQYNAPITIMDKIQILTVLLVMSREVQSHILDVTWYCTWQPQYNARLYFVYVYFLCVWLSNLITFNKEELFYIGRFTPDSFFYTILFKSSKFSGKLRWRSSSSF